MVRALAHDNSELQAEISYQEGRFCAVSDENVGGCKDRASEHLQRAASTAAPKGSIRSASEEELKRLQGKPWFF
jgi:hypothetical protein